MVDVRQERHFQDALAGPAMSVIGVMFSDIAAGGKERPTPAL